MKGLLVEYGRERRCLHDDTKDRHGDPLLALLKDEPKQGILEMLELTNWSGVIRLHLACEHRQDGVVVGGSLCCCHLTKRE